MKIFTQEKDKLVHFEDINVGEAFYSQNMDYPYMKTQKVELSSNNVVNAVNLHDGILVWFLSGNIVRRANIHIEDD